MLPFDATEANFCRCFADLLQACAGGFGIKERSCGAWMSTEPFLHVGLVLVFGGLVFKYVGYFADLFVIGCRDWSAWVRGSAGDVEGVPV